MASLPAPLAAFVDTLQPLSIAYNALPVVGGFAAAKVGGALLKLAPPVEDFANGGDYQEAAVQLAGGVLIDGAVTAGVAVAFDKGKAAKVGGLMLVGTVLGAAEPIVSPLIAQGVDAATDMVAGLFGLDSAPGGEDVYGQLPAGLADFDPSAALPPAGLEDFTPGGSTDPYGESAFG